jgi:hypothetical protein
MAHYTDSSHRRSSQNTSPVSTAFPQILPSHNEKHPRKQPANLPSPSFISSFSFSSTKAFHFALSAFADRNPAFNGSKPFFKTPSFAAGSASARRPEHRVYSFRLMIIAFACFFALFSVRLKQNGESDPYGDLLPGVWRGMKALCIRASEVPTWGRMAVVLC